jgi:DNA-binding CsgD family transcriptional regulator/PAS domain-containing protein
LRTAESAREVEPLPGPAEQAPGSVADAVLAQALSTTTQRVAVIDLATLRIRDVSAPLRLEFAGTDLRGADPRQLIVGGPSEAVPLLATGRIDGYELIRAVRLPTGVEDAYIWVHALGDERPALSAVVVIDLEDARTALPAKPKLGGTVVLGTVDDEWRIDRVSADAKGLLGFDTDGMKGTTFLTLLHPSDLAGFLTGLGHGQAEAAAVTLRARIRRADGGYRWMRMQLSPLGARAAFAFSLAPFSAGQPAPESAAELEQTIARIAREVHSARTARRAGTLPSLVEVPLLAKLTAREWEIASIVRTGASIDDVAQSLHLSASTVRNHLSAIYGKLGVRSLAQLLVLLHAADELDSHKV